MSTNEANLMGVFLVEVVDDTTGHTYASFVCNCTDLHACVTDTKNKYPDNSVKVYAEIKYN